MTTRAWEDRTGRLVLVFLCLSALSPLACSEGAPPSRRRARQPPLVEVAGVRRSAVVDRLELTGVIEPVTVAKMASPVEGPVIASLVREGDRVRRGQLLARLGHVESDSAAAQAARIELARANLELERVERLVKTGALAEEALDDARVKVSDAEAKLVVSSARVSYYQVVAPWAGIVSAVPVVVGDFVPARTTLVEFFDPESLVLRFAVPEAKAIALRNDLPLEVSLDAQPGRMFSGKVTRVYPDLDRQTHTRLVEAVLDGDVALLPGMFARIKVNLASVPDAVVVPRRALVHSGGAGGTAFVVTRGQKVSKRALRLGIEDGELVQVVEGLDVGEKVVVAGHAKLRDGAKVRVAKAGATKGRALDASQHDTGKTPSPGTTRSGSSSSWPSDAKWRLAPSPRCSPSWGRCRSWVSPSISSPTSPIR